MCVCARARVCVFPVIHKTLLFNLLATNLTYTGPCIANTRIFAEYNQQDATFYHLFIAVGSSTCFRRFCPSIIRSSKLHIQRQVFVTLARLAASSSNGLTSTWRCMFSFELLMMDGKTRLKHVKRVTEINCETEEWKPTICHLLLYSTTYRLNMFRTILCPSATTERQRISKRTHTTKNHKSTLTLPPPSLQNQTTNVVINITVASSWWWA